ncbi:MAG: hypothetical protein WDM80_16070 [Limisphaerales bacterium]
MTNRFELRFSEFHLAECLAKCKPPNGFKVTVSKPIWRASVDSDVIMKVTFTASISVKMSAGVIAVVSLWVSKKLKAKVKRRKNKKSRINNNVIPLNKRNIILLIENEMAAQAERDAQWRQDKQNKNSNCDEVI